MPKIFKRTAPTSVDKVVSAFNTTLRKLDVAAASHNEHATGLDDEAAALAAKAKAKQAEAARSRAEAERAARIAENLSKLVEAA